MRIGEFSKKTGFSIDTIRYYEKLGLIIPQRQEKGRKTYTEIEEYRANMVKKLKEMKFSLSEIEFFLKADEAITGPEYLSRLDYRTLSDCLVILEKIKEELEEKELEIKEAKRLVKALTVKIRTSVCEE
jgi:DNA-binding transcriptional MerR regulator